MSLVVADTTPLNYLVLCEAIEALRLIYTQVVIPSAVFNELCHERTPTAVRRWVESMPAWASVRTPAHTDAYLNLGPGEREAIALAVELNAAEILIDERVARSVARERGLIVTGTIGVLEEAASRGFLDLRATFEKLRGTNFRFEESMIEAALERDARRKQRRQG